MINQNKNMPNPPRESITEVDILRSLKGLNSESRFDEELPKFLGKESDIAQEELQARSRFLEYYVPGLNLDPSCTPDSKQLQLLTQRDWEDISQHKSPIMLLWSRVRLQEVRAKEEEIEDKRVRMHSSKPSIFGGELEQINDQATIESMPLIHGTSYASLLLAIENGGFVGNRELDMGANESLLSGSTLAIDRDLGLDQYVFADFGRPHMHRIGSQPEVTVVIGPEAMLAPGSFITEKDIADCKDTAEYMSGMSLPLDFHETALRRIRSSISDDTYYDYSRNTSYNAALDIRRWVSGSNADPVFKGGQDVSTFSTWEVKMPEVPIQLVRKLVFRNKQQYDDFKTKYGDIIPAIFEPRLERSNLDVLRDNNSFDERYKALLDEDYQERVNQLEQAVDVEDAYVILGRLRNIEQTDEDLVSKSRPDWFAYQGAQSVYKTREDLEKAVIQQRGSQQEWEAQLNRRREGPVAVAKIRYSRTTGVSVIKEISWIEQPFGEKNDISASISDLS